MTEDTDDSETDSTRTDERAAASSTYKVLGEFAAASGAGVLGKNTAGSGTPIGVEGAVPKSATGYGLATPDDARIEGAVDTAETDFVVAAGTTATSDATNVVLGHASNTATSGTVGGTVGGGGYDDGTTDRSNRVSGDYATVGGGQNNEARAKQSTIGGGDSNVVRGKTRPSAAAPTTPSGRSRRLGQSAGAPATPCRVSKESSAGAWATP